MTPTIHFTTAILLSVVFNLRLSVAQNTANPADDWTTSGSYQIAYCNANDPSVEHPEAAYLQALLPTVWSYIQNLLQDITLGTSSPHGYGAFFKTNDNLEAVRQVFQDIADGPDILTGAWNKTTETFTGPAHWTPPLIVCVKPGDLDTLAGQEACNSGGRYTTTVGGVPKNSGIVYLWPIFFYLPMVAQKAACPGVNPNANKFVGSGLDLGRSQYAVLVHELVHVYHTMGIGEGMERYGIQETVELSAEKSLANPMNFAFYAAGMCSLV